MQKEKLKQKIENQIKDDKAFASAPIIAVFVMISFLFFTVFFNFVITKGDSFALKRKIIEETSILNASLAEEVYDSISSGTYSNFKTIIESDQIRQVVSDWKTNTLSGELGISTESTPYKKTRILCDSFDVILKDVDVNTNTVHYVIEIINPRYMKKVGGSPDDANNSVPLNNISIPCSYTFNGYIDVDLNEGNVAYQDSNLNTTNPDNQNIQEFLDDLNNNDSPNAIEQNKIGG